MGSLCASNCQLVSFNSAFSSTVYSVVRTGGWSDDRHSCNATVVVGGNPGAQQLTARTEYLHPRLHLIAVRSEERRVGKECSYGCAEGSDNRKQVQITADASADHLST